MTRPTQMDENRKTLDWAAMDPRALDSGVVPGEVSCTYSVVVPIYNERETLPELERRLSQTLGGLGGVYEIIFVNDGSSDGSLDMLKGFSQKDPRLKVIGLSRNFGHQAALYAGMRRAQGEAVILMDGDLQDPPEVLPELVRRWHEGANVVYAVRRKRKENVFKRFIYAAYYRLLRSVAYVDIPLDSGDFCLMERQVVSVLCAMPERNKFLRGLRSWVGFKQASVEYERDVRYAGKTKYTLRKLVKLALDGVTAYSYAPLRIAYVFGFIVSAVSFVLGAVYFTQRILLDAYVPQGFTTLAILILFLGGVQLLSIGLLGEYIGRIYDEVKRRPEYLEREVIGF